MYLIYILERIHQINESPILLVGKDEERIFLAEKYEIRHAILT